MSNSELEEASRIARDVLASEFSNTAEWRRRRAEAHPNDKRNMEAAELLDRLSESAMSVDIDILSEYLVLHEDIADGEESSEMRRSIGFHYWPETAEQFCKDFIANRTGG